MTDIQITVTGPVTVNQLDTEAITGPILEALEATMSTVLENLAAVQAKADAQGGAITALAAAFADLASDVRATLAAAADPSVDEQAALDQLGATLDSSTAAAAAALSDMQTLDTEVGDADGSDTPPTPEG